jgi:hypothetical protein
MRTPNNRFRPEKLRNFNLIMTIEIKQKKKWAKFWNQKSGQYNPLLCEERFT